MKTHAHPACTPRSSGIRCPSPHNLPCAPGPRLCQIPAAPVPRRRSIQWLPHRSPRYPRQQTTRPTPKKRTAVIHLAISSAPPASGELAVRPHLHQLAVSNSRARAVGQKARPAQRLHPMRPLIASSTRTQHTPPKSAPRPCPGRQPARPRRHRPGQIIAVYISAILALASAERPIGCRNWLAAQVSIHPSRQRHTPTKCPPAPTPLIQPHTARETTLGPLRQGTFQRAPHIVKHQFAVDPRIPSFRYGAGLNPLHLPIRTPDPLGPRLSVCINHQRIRMPALCDPVFRPDKR